jgi:hypothetical protein
LPDCSPDYLNVMFSLKSLTKTTFSCSTKKNAAHSAAFFFGVI